MQITKRQFLHTAGAVTLASATGMRSAYAQDYPSQDIHVVCAFPPGSGADVLVRYFAEKLRPIGNRTVIVENKAGAGGNIATEYVARAKPDGYTIFVHAGTAVAAGQSPVQETAGRCRQGNPRRRDHQSPALHARGRCRSPYKTVAELTAAMKQKGDKASYATAAPTGRIMGEIYKDGPAEGGGGELPQRAGFAQRDAERQARLRHARSGVLARAGARGTPAHPRSLHRQAARRDAGPCRP